VKVGATRLFKTVVTKSAGDALNGFAGPWVFEKIFGTIPAIYARSDARLAAISAQAIPALVKATLVREENDAVLHGFEHLANLRKGLSLSSSAKSLFKGLLFDATKTFAKSQIDTYEEQAWYRYFAADLYARAAYSFWQTVSDDYWQRYDAYQQLIADKQALIASWDPSTSTRTVRSVAFDSTGTLTVTLSVTQPDGAPPVALGVTVNGKSAAVNGPTATRSRRGRSPVVPEAVLELH